MRKIKRYKKLIRFLFLICVVIIFPSCSGPSNLSPSSSIAGNESVEIKASDKYGVRAFKIYPKLYNPPTKVKEHAYKEIFNQPIEVIKNFAEKVAKGDMNIKVPANSIPREVHDMYLTKRQLQAAKSIEKNATGDVFKITIENYSISVDSGSSFKMGTGAGNCGSFPMLDSYGGREADSHRMWLYPKILIYELRLTRISDSQTSVEVNLKETKGWLLRKGDNLYDIDDKYFPYIESLVTCAFHYNYEKQIIYGIKLALINYEYEEKQKKMTAEKKQKKEEDERKEIEEQKAREEKNRLEEEQRLARKKELLQKYLPQCNESILTMYNFIAGKNPYADKNKCALITAGTFQMASEKAGLFRVGDEILYIEFPKAFRGSYVRGIAKIKGVYTYQSRLGANTVPHLQMIDNLSDYEYYLLEKNEKQVKGTLRQVVGEIIAVDKNTITVRAKNKEVTVTCNDDTNFSKGSNIKDLKVGNKVTVRYVEYENENIAKQIR